MIAMAKVKDKIYQKIYLGESPAKCLAKKLQGVPEYANYQPPSKFNEPGLPETTEEPLLSNLEIEMQNVETTPQEIVQEITQAPSAISLETEQEIIPPVNGTINKNEQIPSTAAQSFVNSSPPRLHYFSFDEDTVNKNFNKARDIKSTNAKDQPESEIIAESTVSKSRDMSKIIDKPPIVDFNTDSPASPDPPEKPTVLTPSPSNIVDQPMKNLSIPEFGDSFWTFLKNHLKPSKSISSNDRKSSSTSEMEDEMER